MPEGFCVFFMGSYSLVSITLAQPNTNTATREAWD
jgi:hypothetical protein